MFKRTEDDPKHVGDVALMAELQVDDVVATDPECEIRKIHDCPDPGDAFDHRGDRTHCGGVVKVAQTRLRHCKVERTRRDLLICWSRNMPL